MGVKFNTYDRFKYKGFRGLLLPIYFPAGEQNNTGFVFHPKTRHWYTIEEYGSVGRYGIFYVRVGSQYETFDRWHLAALRIAEIFRDRFSNWWERTTRLFKPKPKYGFSSIFPVASRVVARAVAMDLVPVQPMSMPTGNLFYLDYVMPGTQLELSFPPDPPVLVQRRVKSYQLTISFPSRYDDIMDMHKNIQDVLYKKDV